jgi:hypothetical protein
MSLRGWVINEFLAQVKMGKTPEQAFNIVVRDERDVRSIPNLDLHARLVLPLGVVVKGPSQFQMPQGALIGEQHG